MLIFVFEGIQIFTVGVWVPIMRAKQRIICGDPFSPKHVLSPFKFSSSGLAASALTLSHLTGSQLFVFEMGT